MSPANNYLFKTIRTSNSDYLQSFTAQKMKFSIKDFFSFCAVIQVLSDGCAHIKVFCSWNEEMWLVLLKLKYAGHVFITKNFPFNFFWVKNRYCEHIRDTVTFNLYIFPFSLCSKVQYSTSLISQCLSLITYLHLVESFKWVIQWYLKIVMPIALPFRR